MEKKEKKPLYLSATKLAMRIGSQPRLVNTLLAELGYQEPIEGQRNSPWAPTELGLEWSKVVHGKDVKGKDYSMLVWHPDLAEVLGSIAAPSRAEFDELKAEVARLTARFGV